jgi:hypothetical protein
MLVGQKFADNTHCWGAFLVSHCSWPLEEYPPPDRFGGRHLEYGSTRVLACYLGTEDRSPEAMLLEVVCLQSDEWLLGPAPVSHMTH